MASEHEYRTRKGKRRWYVSYRDAGGKQHTKRGFTRKCDAEDYAARMLVSVNDGGYIDPQLGKVSVNHLAATWLEGKKGAVKPKYWGDLESSWRVHVQPKWGRRQVGKLRYSEVQAWVSAMGAERSATIVRRAYDVLNGVCKLAVKDGVLRKNPCEGVQLPRKTHKARTYLTVEQLLALADAAVWRRSCMVSAGTPATAIARAYQPLPRADCSPSHLPCALPGNSRSSCCLPMHSPSITFITEGATGTSRRSCVFGNPST